MVSFSGDERRFDGCGTTNEKRQTVKIELLSQWKLEAQFRNNLFSRGKPFPLGRSEAAVGFSQHG